MKISSKPPFISNEKKILILGSAPGKKSIESDFYYQNRGNKFWQLLAKVLNDKVPTTVEDQKSFLNRHGISLWDVISECDREGSLDKNIKNVVVNNIPELGINNIFCNGGKAYDLFREHFPNMNCIKLSSSSQANGWTKDLNDVREWSLLAEV